MPLTDLLNGIEIGIIVLSISLFALSLIAFRRSGLTRILFASAAFALFAIQLFLELGDDLINFVSDVEADIILSVITLAILLLFFLAILRKNSK